MDGQIRLNAPIALSLPDWPLDDGKIVGNAMRHITCGTPRGRFGATLVEVLMAVMIMGIGLVSVAALFPMSMIRSIHANQLTTGTILRYNAETNLDAKPERYRRPDGTTDPAPDPNPVIAFAQKWPYAGTNFMYDPLGRVIGGYPATISLIGGGTSQRFDGGFNNTNIENAVSFLTSPDTWFGRYETLLSTPISIDTTTTPHTSTLTLTNLTTDMLLNSTSPVSLQNTTRVTIFDPFGTNSVVKNLANANLTITPASNTLTWQSDPELPSAFGTSPNFGVGNIRIENLEPRYSWLFTANQKSIAVTGIDPQTAITIVVMFRRSYEPTEYTPVGNAGANVFVYGSNQASLTFPASDPPFLKKGSWVLEPGNMRWYHILNVLKPNDTTATLTLETPADFNSKSAIFMRGIVDVYPLNPKTPNGS